MKYESNFTWNIQSKHSNVDFYLYQWNSLVGSYSVTFNIESDKGDIAASLRLNEEFYGWKVEANAPEGSIKWMQNDWETNSLSLTSDNFALRESRLFFDFLSLNGDIKITG